MRFMVGDGRRGLVGFLSLGLVFIIVFVIIFYIDVRYFGDVYKGIGLVI